MTPCSAFRIPAIRRFHRPDGSRRRNGDRLRPRAQSVPRRGFFRAVTQTTTTTLNIHDIDGHIIAETDTAGVTLREYIWLDDLPVAVVDQVNTAAPVIYYVHTDHLGRPARMIAQNWSWAWDVIYSPFGGVATIFDTTTKLDMRFPGQWFQLETGLAYNWHRHYDSTLGRYLGV